MSTTKLPQHKLNTQCLLPSVQPCLESGAQHHSWDLLLQLYLNEWIISVTHVTLKSVNTDCDSKAWQYLKDELFCRIIWTFGHIYQSVKMLYNSHPLWVAILPGPLSYCWSWLWLAIAMVPNEFDVVFDVSWWLSSHFSSASLAVPDNRSILQQISMDPFSPLNLRKKFEMVTSLLVQGNYWRHGTSSQTTFFIENPLKSFTLAYYVYWQWFFIPDVK